MVTLELNGVKITLESTDKSLEAKMAKMLIKGHLGPKNPSPEEGSPNPHELVRRVMRFPRQLAILRALLEEPEWVPAYRFRALGTGWCGVMGAVAKNGFASGYPKDPAWIDWKFVENREKVYRIRPDLKKELTEVMLAASVRQDPGESGVG